MHHNILSPKCVGLKQKQSFYYSSWLLWVGNLRRFTWMILAGGVSCSCSHMEAWAATGAWSSWELRGHLSSSSLRAFPHGLVCSSSQHGGLRAVILLAWWFRSPAQVFLLRNWKFHILFWPSLNSHEVTLRQHSIGYNRVTNLVIVKKEIKLYVLIGYNKFLEEQERCCFHPLWKTISHSLPRSHNSHLFHIRNALTCSQTTTKVLPHCDFRVRLEAPNLIIYRLLRCGSSGTAHWVPFFLIQRPVNPMDNYCSFSPLHNIECWDRWSITAIETHFQKRGNWKHHSSLWSIAILKSSHVHLVSSLIRAESYFLQIVLHGFRLCILCSCFYPLS